jgi:hypothetical protein
MSNQNFTLTVYKFSTLENNSNDYEIDYRKDFESQEAAREYVKSIYKFINKLNISFRKNYTIAELRDLNNTHVEDYVGRGMLDSINKIQIWSRDKYDMVKGDNTWRIKDIILAAA